MHQGGGPKQFLQFKTGLPTAGNSFRPTSKTRSCQNFLLHFLLGQHHAKLALQAIEGKSLIDGYFLVRGFGSRMPQLTSPEQNHMPTNAFIQVISQNHVFCGCAPCGAPIWPNPRSKEHLPCESATNFKFFWVAMRSRSHHDLMLISSRSHCNLICLCLHWRA